MSNHTPSSTYANQLADIAAANSTLAGSVATAASTLAAALSAAAAAYKPNDGGIYVAAIKAAYAARDTAVITAQAINDKACATSQQQQKSALPLPL